MITLIYFGIVAVSIAMAVYVLFIELPDVSIDVARNNLFKLRDELFKLGESNRVSFESRTYQMNRGLLNGLIRYSHDISLMHMGFSRLVLPKESIRFTRAIRKTMESDLKAQPADVRKELKRIFDAAHSEMVMLMINRSLMLTIFMRSWWILAVAKAMLVELVKAATAKNSADKKSGVIVSHTAVDKQKEAIAHVRPVVESSVVSAPSFKWAKARMSSKIDSTAWGYVPAGEVAAA